MAAVGTSDDVLAIQQVLTRYTRAVDTGRWALLDDVFLPDATIDYTSPGGISGSYPEVRAWLAEVLPAFFPRRMHLLGQVDVDFTAPDAASVVAYFHNPMVTPAADGAAGAGALVEFGGLYHHLLSRTASGWRSRELVVELVWSRGPTQE